MANVNAPRGFTPVKYRSGKAYTGAAKRYYKSASVILGVGDPVIRAADSSSPDGFAAVTRATTGGAITGVVVGFEPKRSDLTSLCMAAADTGYLLVADDPDLLFMVQEGTGGTPLAVTNIGECINSITAVNANTTTGRSKYAIDNSALSAGNTFRLEELVQKEDNAVGDSALWLVSVSLSTEVTASASNKTAV